MLPNFSSPILVALYLKYMWKLEASSGSGARGARSVIIQRREAWTLAGKANWIPIRNDGGEEEWNQGLRASVAFSYPPEKEN